MTTNNLTGLQELLDQADAAHQQVEEITTVRAKEILDAQVAAEKKKADADRRALIAARAREQRFIDQQSERDEEAAQLRFILDGSNVPAPADSAPVVEPTPEPAPADPDPAVVVPAPADPPTRTDLPPIPPQPVPAPAAAPNGVLSGIGLLILLLLAVFFAVFFGWNWIADHAKGDNEFAQNELLAFGIAAVATVGIGFCFWNRLINNRT